MQLNNYLQPRFWIVVLVLVCVNTLIAGTLGALLFFVDVGYPKLDLSRIAVLFGTSLLQVILAVFLFLVIVPMTYLSVGKLFCREQKRVEIRRIAAG